MGDNMTENICSKLRACLNQKVEDNCCLIPVQWVKDTIELIEQQQIDIEYFKATCREYYNKYNDSLTTSDDQRRF